MLVALRADFRPLFASDLIRGYWPVRSKLPPLISWLLKQVDGSFCVIWTHLYLSNQVSYPYFTSLGHRWYWTICRGVGSCGRGIAFWVLPLWSRYRWCVYWIFLGQSTWWCYQAGTYARLACSVQLWIGYDSRYLVWISQEFSPCSCYQFLPSLHQTPCLDSAKHFCRL